MIYPATIIEVLIASPSDVKDERDSTRDIINSWNYLNSRSSGVALMPVGWETHSHPQLGNHPQEIVNTQVAKGCDLLIAIFWARLGTPTEKFESGTVEEIKNHLKAKKPVMMYFSSTPPPQDHDRDQFKALQKFKDWCKTKGLIQNFGDHSEFREKLTTQLQLKLNNDPFFSDIKKYKDYIEINPDNVVNASGWLQAPLSEDAEKLLSKAVTGRQQQIVRRPEPSRSVISVDKKPFGDGSPREFARWDSALQELDKQGFVHVTDTSSNIFKITQRGYERADYMESKITQ